MFPNKIVVLYYITFLHYMFLFPTFELGHSKYENLINWKVYQMSPNSFKICMKYQIIYLFKKIKIK